MSETTILKSARAFREISKKHHVGSSKQLDLQYIAKKKQILTCSNFQKQDNLLLPSPSLLLHQTRYSLYVDPAKDIYTSPSEQYSPLVDSSQVQVSEKQLGVSQQGFAKNLPIPNKSTYVYKHQNEQRVMKQDLLDPDIVGLLLRSYLVKEFNEIENRFISNFMFSPPPGRENLTKLYQDKAWEIFSNFIDCTGVKSRSELILRDEKIHKMGARKLKLKQLPQIDFGKRDHYFITFNSTKDKPCELNKVYKQTIVFRNKKKLPAKFKVLLKSMKSKDYDLIISPNCYNKACVIKKGQNITFSFSFNAHRPLRKLEKLVVVEVDGGRRVYFGVRAFVETKAFGIDPELLECEEVEGIGRIPKVLEHLKREIIRKNALKTVGIFRKAGHELQMKKIRKEFDSDNYVMCKNVNNFATLIKIWFRVLPTKVFDFFPTSYFKKLDAQNTAVCLDTLNRLPEMSRNLINWLLDLMIKIEENSEVNKMTASNLAIVFSPNLYEAKSKNPATLMMMTSKMSQFFQTILELRIAQGDSEDESEGEYETDSEEDGFEENYYVNQ